MALSAAMSHFLSILLFVSSSYAIVSDDVVFHEFAVSSSCTGRRTLWNIITSCATTLFACAWTAIHPNMPGPVEGAIVVGVRRLSIMILALVAPEVVVMWAIRQLFAARMVQKRFQEALQDGTLELRIKASCEPRLVSGKVPREADEIRITIPEEVTGSWSEKLASLRSFISATFHRTSHPHEKLNSSSISVESLQSYCHWSLKHSFYAWMGGFMLFIGGDPALPREIYHPLTPDELLEFLKTDRVQMSMVSEKDLDDRSKGDWLSKAVAVLQLAWFVIHLAARAFGQLPTTQLEIDALAISILSCFTYAFWWYKPKDVQCPVPVYWKGPGDPPEIKYSVPQSIGEFMRQFGVKKSWIGDRFSGIFRPLLNLGGIQCVSDTAVKAHRVPYFCGYPPDVDRETLGQSLPVSIIGALAGMVFGGVHCIAWNFTFPTYAERALWRIASLTMAVMPGFALAAIAYLYLASDGRTIPHAAALTRASFAIAFLYVNCRLIVMVLMLLSLRSPPAGVYDEVCWASFIPHWQG